MQSLLRGQKVKLAELTTATMIQVGLAVTAPAGIIFDISCFGVDAQDKLSDDRYFIFYNQKSSPDGSLVSSGTVGGDNERFQIDLTRLPPTIRKLVFTVTSDQEGAMAQIRQGHLRIVDRGNEVGKFSFSGADFKAEKAIIAAEIYFKDVWRMAAVGQGFNGGLNALLKHFGGTEIATPPAQAVASIATSLSPTINLQKVSGQVRLTKGQKPVMIEKTVEITTSISWRTGTDYDVYALIYTKDGRQVDVATFGATGVPPLQIFDNGEVQHMGDVGREGGSIKTEIVKIRLNDNILAVVPVAYSAQSNGTGSFHRYEVSMSIDNHRGTTVTVPANHADRNDTVYTCVPGMILNTPHGVIIEPLELYSKPNSENRPKLVRNENGHIKVLMDAGPKNDYK